MTNQEIADKLDAIGAELEAHPERWTQGAFARSVDGECTLSSSRGAACWCVAGFMTRYFGANMYPDPYVTRAIDDNMFARWNDVPGRTAAEVAAAFHRAAQLAREATHA